MEDLNLIDLLMRDGDGEPFYKPYYHFRWEIEHPFLPFRRSEATFYNRKWKAAIQPMSMTLTNREFDFSLEYNSPHRLPTNRILLHITLNENVVYNHNFRGVCFSPGHERRFSFRCIDCEIRNHEIIPNFVIKVGIYVHRRREPEVEPGADNFQLSLLATDMKKLFQEAPYSDYKFFALQDYPETYFAVHSYILRQRWSTFFKGPEYRPRYDHSVLHMSAAVLTDILRYVYTGEIDAHVLNKRGVEHFSELCEIINKYEMNDLRRSLYLKDFIEVRIDKKTSLTKHTVTPLYMSDDGPMESISHTEEASLDNKNKLYLAAQVSYRHDAAGSWLSYSIRSNAQVTIHVHVVFMFEEYLIGCSARTVSRPVLSQDQIISPNATFGSGPILWLNCPSVFPELNQSRRDRRYRSDRRHRIKAIWHVTDGTTFSRFEMNGGFEPDDDNDARVALGEDMCRLYNDYSRTKERDFFLVTRQDYLFELHKGIFAIRVPKWQNVLVDSRDLRKLPNNPRCDISVQAMQHILNYMYMARSTAIPDNLKDEIQKFARDGGDIEFLTSLHDSNV